MTKRSSIKTVYVVSHTHWDREWYQDYQGFRTRLVYMIDELLDTMEANPDYRYFLMDGQTIVIDDYLEIRPERREQLTRFIRESRIGVGPWYVMPDEFLVSGESLIRNLQTGFRESRKLGTEPVKSGYVTDIFGHNSQFPQLLRGFGIDNAVLFRGFRGDGDPAEMEWEGADGSRVLGLKLDEDRAYGDFYFFLRWPFVDREFRYEEPELIERAISMLAYKNKRATTDIMMGMDGVDHIEIEPRLPWMLQTLNEAEGLEGVTFRHATLEQYLEALRGKVSDLKLYQGEQRTNGFNGINNWVLVNVLSSRIHLKQRNQQCELLLEKWAEPWAVFAGFEGRAYPRVFLEKAWQFLLQNHPHDSICGCSIDQVHRDMIYRFDQSRLIAQQMNHEQLHYLANHIDPSGLVGSDILVVYNPLQDAGDGVVVVDAELPHDGAGGLKSIVLGGSFLQLRDASGQLLDCQVVEIARNKVRRIRKYRDIPSAETVDRLKLAFVGSIPPCGYAAFAIEKTVIPVPAFGEYGMTTLVQPRRLLGTMKVNETTWNNGRIEMRVNENGTIRVTNLHTGKVHDGLLLFEDAADIGEGWNYVAPANNAIFHSAGCRAVISTVTDGPLVSIACVEINFIVPAGITHDDTSRRDDKVGLGIRTYLELRKDDPVLRCQTIVNNTARNHRLKLLFPSGVQTDHHFASTPFDLVKRPNKQNDAAAHLETARGDAPYNGIVALRDDTAGLALYSKGLYEMAMKEDEARTVALTLYRSTDKEVLSDGGDGGQLLCEMTFDYAIRPFEAQTVSLPNLWAEREQFAAGLQSLTVRRDDIRYESLQRRERDLPAVHSYVQVDNGAVRISALQQAEQLAYGVNIRLFNSSEHAETAVVRFDRPIESAEAVSLDEQPIADFTDLHLKDGAITITLGAKRIQTIRLTFGS
ncbi:glycoside hydrolase family 38 C-terminal domain-containing protein [Paenibacillus sp. CF384]|uniref:alpha-mannosidase n=1 Tax=Paenibacillus sp. CF384 TaxID=1884382 RepID=UPI00089BE7FB|nr:glycoside hydrolase family 38 C-terminal domain-containing protein [Paenibacillus sp. CF384]SDX20514.1 alpha-mannosidase/mannosylglycerate hydrolase [Paenibacillus sp. CF384]